VRCAAQAELAVDSGPLGRVLSAWSRNLGAIFYTRGDRKSGAVRALTAYTLRTRARAH
jgi:hypothetical protein